MRKRSSKATQGYSDTQLLRPLTFLASPGTQPPPHQDPCSQSEKTGNKADHHAEQAYWGYLATEEYTRHSDDPNQHQMTCLKNMRLEAWFKW
jgi:hypothetical protein